MITTVELLGHKGMLEFTQGADGLKVKLPDAPPCKYAYALKIAGWKMNPPTEPSRATRSDGFDSGKITDDD